jgi:GMP synthase (glutamine-hydrolysing)
MRAVVLSHRQVAAELGHIGDWLTEKGFGVERVHREDAPAVPDADLLVVLGSPNSVATGHCEPPALTEIALVKDWVERGRPYVGICFGAQVLARALGGSVRRMDTTYRAFAEVDCADEAPPELSGKWVLWHEDAITAPPDARVLARVPHADVAFRRGNAIGLQPHIEFDSEIVERLARIVNIADDEWRPLRDALEREDANHATRARSLLDAVWLSFDH